MSAVPLPLPAAPGAKVRLHFLDSIRALAALYVMVGHVTRQLMPYDEAFAGAHPAAYRFLSFLFVAFLGHGHFAVALFIFISGFCLMIPLAVKGSLSIESLPSFLQRRARRILPPYYAVLLLSAALIYLIPGMGHVATGEWAEAYPAFEPANLLAHLFLIHHWSDAWIMKINPPLWSIGVEWQIYFLMPTLFLPLLRGTGKRFTVVLMAALAIALTYLAEPFLPLKQSYIHFIAIFTVGMVTALSCLHPEARSKAAATAAGSGRVWLGLTFLLLLLLALQARQSLQHFLVVKWIAQGTYQQTWVMDFLVAAWTSALVLTMAHPAPAGWRGGLFRILHARWLVFVGHFSYSLYLIHDPMLRMVALAGEKLGFSAAAQYLWLPMAGPLLAIAAGYALYLLVERHFISMVPVHSRQTPPEAPRTPVQAL